MSIKEKNFSSSSPVQCVHATERLARVGIRREEFLLLKAVVIANCDAAPAFASNDSMAASPADSPTSSTFASSSSSSNSRANSNGALWKLRESLLSALYDCVAVIR